MICRLYFISSAGLDPDLALWQKAISYERLKKIECFKGKSEKQLSLAAELCLCAASLDLGLPVPPIYKYGETGKPCFPVSPPFFNLSHCRGYAVCAVAGCEIGVDIEAPDRPVPPGVLKRLLAPNETADLPIEKWVAKESFIKLTGEGLRRDFRSFFTQDSTVFSADGRLLAHLAFPQISGLCVAVASKERLTVDVIPLSASSLSVQLKRAASSFSEK